MGFQYNHYGKRGVEALFFVFLLMRAYKYTVLSVASLFFFLFLGVEKKKHFVLFCLFSLHVSPHTHTQIFRFFSHPAPLFVTAPEGA